MLLLCIDLLRLLLSFCHTTASYLSFDITVLFFELLLLNYQLLYATKSHLLGIFKILDSRFCYRYVNMNFAALLSESIDNCCLLLDQVLVLEYSSLLIECDIVFLDDFVLVLDPVS